MSILADILGGAANVATGGIGGLVARVVPEIFHIFTAGADRKHELEMRRLDIQAAKDGTEARIREQEAAGAAAVDSRQMDAYVEAIKAQGQRTGIWLADFLNALVRPLMAYYWMGLYAAYKLALFTTMVTSGTGVAEAVLASWTPDDTAFLGGVIGFFLPGRVFDKRAGAR